MQVTPNQNTNKVNNTRPNNAPVQGAVQNTAAKPVQQQCSQYCGCPQYCPPQGAYYPQQVNYQTQSQQPQNVQVPATAAGVNIQIFNPSAGLPGAAAPTYNVNAPCYPSEYYTGTLGSDGKLHPNGGNGGNGGAGGVGGNGETGGGVTQSGGTQNGGNGGSSGVTQGGGIQSGGDGGSSTERETVTKETTSTNGNKKTEKRKIVQLTDDYIKALESSLNSQDENVRRNAAQEVYNRLEEDDSRCDDKALTALINKMLQDPEDTVRLLALSALEQRIVLGDDYTVNVLKNMQQTNSGYGQDAIDANKILLKMAGKQVEKEFEVKDKPSTETETTTTTETSKKE